MRKEITMEGRTLALSANAATPLRYKMTFQEDLLTALGGVKTEGDNLPDVGEIVAKLAYIMNKQDEGTANEATFEDFLAWLEKFDDPMIFTLKAAEIIQFYMQNVKTTSKPKNARGPRTGK